MDKGRGGNEIIGVPTESGIVQTPFYKGRPLGPHPVQGIPFSLVNWYEGKEKDLNDEEVEEVWRRNSAFPSHYEAPPKFTTLNSAPSVMFHSVLVLSSARLAR